MDKDIVDGIEASLAGMTASRAVERLAEVIAVARRGRSWSWIARWLYAKGVRSQRGDGPLSTETLTNYFSKAKKKGLVDEARVASIVKELDARVRIQTLERIGTEEALHLLLDARLGMKPAARGGSPKPGAKPEAAARASLRQEPPASMPAQAGRGNEPDAAPARSGDGFAPSYWKVPASGQAASAPGTSFSAGSAPSAVQKPVADSRRFVEDGPSAGGPREPTFEDYFDAIMKNMESPVGMQKPWLVVAGTRAMVELRVQKMVAKGGIVDLAGLRAALARD
jgi:hypothetical protein